MPESNSDRVKTSRWDPQPWRQVEPSEHLSSNHVVPDRISNKFGVTFDAKRPHDPILVKRHGPGRHIQGCTNFLHYFAFGEQLQYFPLSLGEPVFFLDQFLR